MGALSALRDADENKTLSDGLPLPWHMVSGGSQVAGGGNSPSGPHSPPPAAVHMELHEAREFA